MKGTCIICDTRPAPRGASRCRSCEKTIARTRVAEREEREWWRKAVRFAIWRGFGVAFMKNGNGTLHPRALPVGLVGKIPRAKTLDLDGYISGLDREQVKAIKRAILQANGAGRRLKVVRA